jgi:hypothetical protein
MAHDETSLDSHDLEPAEYERSSVLFYLQQLQERGLLRVKLDDQGEIELVYTTLLGAKAMKDVNVKMSTVNKLHKGLIAPEARQFERYIGYNELSQHIPASEIEAFRELTKEIQELPLLIVQMVSKTTMPR